MRFVNRKYKYYYFYYLDKNFGFMHVKLQTWFPFIIQVYIYVNLTQSFWEKQSPIS